MFYKKYRLLKFKHLIPYNYSDSNINIFNSTWIYSFKVKIYKNLYIVSNGNYFDDLSLVIK